MTRRFAVMPVLTAGLLAGMFIAVPLRLPAGGPPRPESDTTGLDLERLSDAELETLAFDALTRLSEKRGEVSFKGWPGRERDDPRQISKGVENVRRLLPLGKKLTLRALRFRLKTSALSREKRLIASVRRIVLDPGLGNAAGVWEGDLSTIRIGPGYTAYLTSDDEAMLLLGHELTHVAARGGRLRPLFEGAGRVARESAGLALDEVQKEELACDLIGAEVLRRYMALRPTGRASAERFSRAFGYKPRSERLALAWQDFCLTYNADPDDDEHLSLAHTLRLLPRLNPELKALIPEDAISPRLCR
jgi:hypothetical protein